MRLAVPEFESMHVQPSLTRALELGRSAAFARSSPVTTESDAPFADLVDVLTPREREVATLLALGKSNREIATPVGGVGRLTRPVCLIEMIGGYFWNDLGIWRPRDEGATRPSALPPGSSQATFRTRRQHRRITQSFDAGRGV
jgi:hypothetical protein